MKASVFVSCKNNMTSTNMLDWFFAPTRIKNDQHEVAAREFRNQTSEAISTDSGCSATLNPAAAMADQPGMIARGGFGHAGGCKIDENSELRWGTPGAWKQKGPKQLWARPFATTPNLGGGDPGVVEDESGLIFSAPPRNRKEASTIMDKAIPNFYQPLISVKQTEFSNASNWVEGWTRGGDATRLVQTTRA